MDYLAGETSFLEQWLCSDLGCRRSLLQGSAWYNTWLRDIYPRDADRQVVAAQCPDNKYVSPAQLAHQLPAMPEVQGLDEGPPGLQRQHSEAGYSETVIAVVLLSRTSVLCQAQNRPVLH